VALAISLLMLFKLLEGRSTLIIFYLSLRYKARLVLTTLKGIGCALLGAKMVSLIIEGKRESAFFLFHLLKLKNP